VTAAQFKTMQEIEKTDKRSSFSKSKAAMVLGIVVLLGVIGFLVYLSQPKDQTAHVPAEEGHKRTKESIGVYSRLNSDITEGTDSKTKPEPKSEPNEKVEQPVATEKTEPSIPVEVLKGETTNAATSDSGATESKAPEKATGKSADKAAGKTADKPAMVAAPHHIKKHHRSEETFFELAPNSGKHSPDNLDRVAN
jgi:hypothetical protein